MAMGVYGIRHVETGKYYIGATRDIDKRLGQHRKAIRDFCFGKNPDASALTGLFNFISNKQSQIKDFEFDILEVLDDDRKLPERELHFIKEKNSVANGFNQSYNVDHFAPYTNWSIKSKPNVERIHKVSFPDIRLLATYTPAIGASIAVIISAILIYFVGYR